MEQWRKKQFFSVVIGQKKQLFFIILYTQLKPQKSFLNSNRQGASISTKFLIRKTVLLTISFFFEFYVPPLRDKIFKYHN